MAPSIDPVKQLHLYPLGPAATPTKQYYNETSGKLLVTRQKKRPIRGEIYFIVAPYRQSPNFSAHSA